MAPAIQHIATVKAERTDDHQPRPQEEDDDEKRRATTAMAIVELLATGGGPTAAAMTPSLTSTPSWLNGASSHFNSQYNNNNTSSSSSATRSSESGPSPSFPGLAALLPMKRPLWKMTSNGGGSDKTSNGHHHVHIQPLPSIAQLAKLAVSDRASPTRIDVVAANGSMSASVSPALTPRTPAATPSSATTTSAAPVSVNHSRKRQKDELDKLRVQVQELQRELEHVRARLPKKPQVYTMSGSMGYPDMHASLPSSVTIWERIASHQKEQKNKSEMENMKLKSMVQEQVKISKALEKLVNKRCKNSSLESKFATKRLRVCDSDEQQIFDSLAQSIDERYKQVDAEFEKLGMTYEKRELQEAHMILDTINGPTMELKDATIFPFDVQAINDAVWRSMEVESFSCKESMGMIESLLVQCTDDSISLKTTVPIQQQRSSELDLSIRAVMKRFVERNRVVILWESVSDCLSKLPQCGMSSTSSSSTTSSSSASICKDVEMRDRGWCIIESLPSPPGRHSTIIQLCSHIAPRVTGESSSHMPLQHMHGLVDTIAPCYRYVWGNRQQIMENILMENVVGIPRPEVGSGAEINRCRLTEVQRKQRNSTHNKKRTIHKKKPEMMEEEDTSALLLQTYDALDAFLREMDELDAIDDASSLLSSQAPLRGASALPTLKHEQQVTPASTDGRVLVVKMKSAIGSDRGRSAPPALSGSVRMMATSANVPSASASRKRKHESHTSVVRPVENNTTTTTSSRSTTITGSSSDNSTEVRPVRRRRQKEELLQLRQKALDLETQLQTIKTAMEPRESEQQALVAAKMEKSVAMKMWESHAVQEKKAKQSTEVENARLREIASKELEVSFKIEKLLLQCYTSALSFLPYDRNHELAMDAHTNFLYEMLEKRVDARFQDMEKNRFEFTPALLQGSQKYKSRIMLMGNQETGVEFKRTQIMPFDTTAVDAVSWKTIVHEKDDLCACRSVRTKGNTIAIYAKFTIRRENEQDIELEGHHVLKRFCSKKRIALAWEGVSQWKYTSDSSDNSDPLYLSTHESGWGVLEPLVLPGSVPVTQIQLCTSTLPTKTNGQIAGGGKGSVRDASLLRDLIIPAMEQLFLTRQQIAENALLDELLSKKSLKV